MVEHKDKFLSYGPLSGKEIEEWVKKEQEKSELREKALRQFEEEERLAEKRSRERVIVLTETVKQLL